MVAGKLLFVGYVKDNEDVFLLNRIRVFPETDEQITQVLNELNEDKLNANRTDVKDLYKYTKDDPFCFYPLLPFTISIVPKINEMVWVTYSNPKQKGYGRKEQFYIPSTKSNPFNNVTSENWVQTKRNTSQGFNFKESSSLKSSTPNEGSGKKEYTKPIKGLFAEPGDNAFYGQGSTDLILKPSEILLRSGKIDNIQTNLLEQKSNQKRGFLQISYFQTEKKINPPDFVKVQEVDKTPIKKLIEYDIINTENVTDSFTGSIYIYDLAPNDDFRNDEFSYDTFIPAQFTTPIYTFSFQGQSMSAVTSLINTFINGLNDNKIEIKEPFGNDSISFRENSIFPFYYRPSENIRTKINQPDGSVNTINCINLTSTVKFKKAILSFNGSGLVSQKNKFGKTYKSLNKTYTLEENILSKNSVSILGSSKVFLLSHDSTIIPGKSKINMGPDTIYGIDRNTINDNLIPNTNSLVRGEKLKELFNLIVLFLTTHTHAFPGLPPIPVSFSGVDISQIQAELQLYDEKVLNQNIRIN